VMSKKCDSCSEPYKGFGSTCAACRKSGSKTAAPVCTPCGVPADHCEVCGKKVYAMEAHHVEGRLFHRDCFKCATCGRKLASGNWAKNELGFFCLTHFHQIAKVTGGYKTGTGPTRNAVAAGLVEAMIHRSEGGAIPAACASESRASVASAPVVSATKPPASAAPAAAASASPAALTGKAMPKTAPPPAPEAAEPGSPAKSVPTEPPPPPPAAAPEKEEPAPAEPAVVEESAAAEPAAAEPAAAEQEEPAAMQEAPVESAKEEAPVAVEAAAEEAKADEQDEEAVKKEEEPEKSEGEAPEKAEPALIKEIDMPPKVAEEQESQDAELTPQPAA